MSQCGPPATKFSPNVQTLSSMAHLKQSTSHFHSQTLKKSHNSKILAPTADSKQFNSHLYTQSTKFSQTSQILASMADSIQSNSHLHIQTTKFSHNSQILAPTADSKQSNSHLYTQTTKFSPNAQILSSATYSKQSAASNLLRFGFESHRGHGCLSVVGVVCCQVEVSATSWSLFQRSPTDYGASMWLIWKTRELGGPDPLEAVGPKKKNKTPLLTLCAFMACFTVN